MDTFAERLRHYREKAKYSQKELALLIGVSFAAYNKYETRGNEPKIEVLIKIANTLGIDVNTLVGFKTQDVENQNANKIAIKKSCAKEIEEHATAILKGIKEWNKYYDEFCKKWVVK